MNISRNPLYLSDKADHDKAMGLKYDTRILWKSDLEELTDEVGIVGSRVIAIGPDGEVETVADFLDSNEFTMGHYNRVDWYVRYCQFRASYGELPRPIEQALAETCEVKCWYCGDVFIADVDSLRIRYMEREDITFAWCSKHRNTDKGRSLPDSAFVHKPTPEQIRQALEQKEEYGPEKPYFIQLLEKYGRRDGGQGPTWYRYTDTCPFEDNDCLSMGQVENVYGRHGEEGVTWEDLFEVPYCTYGDYVGDNVTRHNHVTWTEDYKETKGLAWLSLESGYDTHSIVVKPHMLTPEMFDVIMGLDNYSSLDDDNLHVTEQKMQEEALLNWGKYDFPPVLGPYFEKALEFVTDETEKQRYRDRYAEITDDAESCKNLMWELEYAASQEGNSVEWLYESGTSAVLTGDDMEKMAKALKLSHIIPPPEGQQALPLEGETSDV